MREEERRNKKKKPEGLPYGLSPCDRVSLFLGCRVDEGTGDIFADETTLTLLFSASFAGCLLNTNDGDDTSMTPAGYFRYTCSLSPSTLLAGNRFQDPIM